MTSSWVYARGNLVMSGSILRSSHRTNTITANGGMCRAAGISLNYMNYCYRTIAYLVDQRTNWGHVPHQLLKAESHDGDSFVVTGISGGSYNDHRGNKSRASSPHDQYSDVIMSAMASLITGVTIIYPTVCSGADKKKLRVTGLHERNWLVNSPHKWPITRKMFPFDYVIMITPGF